MRSPRRAVYAVVSIAVSIVLMGAGGCPLNPTDNSPTFDASQTHPQWRLILTIDGTNQTAVVQFNLGSTGNGTFASVGTTQWFGQYGQCTAPITLSGDVNGTLVEFTGRASGCSHNYQVTGDGRMNASMVNGGNLANGTVTVSGQALVNGAGSFTDQGTWTGHP